MRTIYLVCGLGGSGTRVVGELLKGCNLDLGAKLNDAFDNLHTFFDSKYYQGIDPFDDESYPRFEQIFTKQLAKGYSASETIVVKEPNFHILIPFVARYAQEKGHLLKIIHVIRDGLYMINSQNRGQLVRWGPRLHVTEVTIRHQQLEYWHLANKRAITLLQQSNCPFLLVDYDQLTTNPEIELDRILQFVQRKAQPENYSKLLNRIKNNRSISKKAKLGGLSQQHQNWVLEINGLVASNY